MEQKNNNTESCTDSEIISNRSCLGSVFYSSTALISLLYVLNIGAGVFEIIPDNLPIIGNLDEAFFIALLFTSLSYFNIRIPLFKSRNTNKNNR